MIILGVDPGLNICGFAAIDFQDDKISILCAGTIRPPAGETLESRLASLANDFDELLRETQCQNVAVEDLYAHYKHPRTAVLMAHARGVILQRSAAFGAKVNSFAATKIKKSLTGNGRASKRQMQLAVTTTLSLTQVPEPPDVADALAAALCCANSFKLENM